MVKMSNVIKFVLLGVTLGAVANLFVCKVNVVGVSMQPSYFTGDSLLVSRVSLPNRGDIVTFTKKNNSYIKRVIGIPGDTVIVCNSNVYVNGNKVVEDYIKDKVFGGNCKYILNKGEYFVMGDNRNYSKDSRDFGVVYKAEILGTKIIDLG